MKTIFKTLSFIISIGVILLADTAFAGKENPLLLALKIECSGNNAGRGPWKSNFFGITTDHTFHGSRWWYGSGDRLGEIGQHTFNGSRTKKSLLIQGEGRWLENNKKKPWKLQFISKGDKPILKHLEDGVGGYEGSGQDKRDCTITLLNKVKANDAIQLDSYARVISGLKNQIDNINAREKEEEKNYNQLVKINENNNKEISTLENAISTLNREIITLENIVSSLNEEINLNEQKIDTFNEELNSAKKNNEFEIKYEKILKQFEDVKIKLENSKSINENLEKQLSLLKESENSLNTSFDNQSKEITSLEDLNLDLKNEIEKYKQKEEEYIKIIEKTENKKLQEEKLAEEKRQAEERKIEEERIEKEEKLKEQQEAERQAQEEINKKLSLLTQETDLEKAQNFLINLESFIKQYPNEFDIITMSEYFIATRSILDGILNFTNETKLQEFRDYVSEESELYLNYSKEISQQNQIEKLNTINAAIMGLDASINELKLIMANNTQSVNLQKWTDAIKIAETTLKELNSYDELINVSIDINGLIKLKAEVDEAIVLLNKTKDELKIYLQENLTTDLAPSILDQIKLIDEAIKNENIEKIIDTNQKSKEFIFKKIIEPEEKRLKEEKEVKLKKIEEEQNKELEKVYKKFNAQNDYQKKIVKLLNMFEVPYEKIEFSNLDNLITIHKIKSSEFSFPLEKIEFYNINKDYLEPWFEFTDKFYWIKNTAEISDLPIFEYKGKFFDEMKVLGFKTNFIEGGFENLKIDEFSISNFDIKEFENIKKILNSDNLGNFEENLLSLILSIKFDKIAFNGLSFENYMWAPFGRFTSTYDSLPNYKFDNFEISGWDQFSFKNILSENLHIEHGTETFSLDEINIDDFKLDKNYLYNLLDQKDSQNLILSGNYSEIFNGFNSLGLLQMKNLNTSFEDDLYEDDNLISFESVKLSNLKFEYFGKNKNIKVPTNLELEIKGSNYNYLRGGYGTTFSDIMVFDLGYNPVKFDFATGWKWNTTANDISFNLDLDIINAASLALKTNLVDLDTNILTLQDTPLLTYLMTTPKLKKFSLSLTDSSFRDKFMKYAAKEQGMTTDQLKDFIIQSIDIYSGTLGIDQGLVKEFLNSTSNFINGNNKIILSVKPPNPVSVNDLSSDMMMQNYEGLVDKLNIRISNF